MPELSTKQAEFITTFADVFAGRYDCYGEGFWKNGDPNTNKVSYALVKQQLTPEVYAQHLRGERKIGVYPLYNNQVKWAAIDFDAPKDEHGLPIPDAFSVAWDEAVTQAKAFEKYGLFPYLERSRSGQGVHCWLFFDQFIDAYTVLRALKPLLLDAASYDRMYPVQSQVDSEGYGNLIALPFNGEAVKLDNSIFIDHVLEQPWTPLEFLQEVQFNPKSLIEELADKAPPLAKKAKKAKALPVMDTATGEITFVGEVGDFAGRPDVPIRGWLKAISPYGCGFLRKCWTDRKTLGEKEWYAMLGQATAFENGREIAHLMSRDYPGYSAEETDEKYDHAMQNPPVGCQYIIDNFPNSGCNGCSRTAPYYMAKKSILELVTESAEPMKKGGFRSQLARIRKRNSGEEPLGTLWNMAGLDDVTRLRPHEMTVIGAPPSIGKTALMTQGIVSVAGVSKTPVFAFSAETGEAGLTDRILSHMTDIDSRRLRGEGKPLTGAEYEALEQAADELDGMPIYINYTATRADQVLDLIEQTMLEHGIPFDSPIVVFFDYLQFGARSKDDQSEVDRISRLSSEFKFIAKILEQGSMVVFSQLRRDAEGNEDVDITMLKNSGRIEADADVIIFLTGERMVGAIAKRLLHVLKQREGRVGDVITLAFHQAVSRFVLDQYSQPMTEKADPFPDNGDPTDGLF